MVRNRCNFSLSLSFPDSNAILPRSSISLTLYVLFIVVHEFINDTAAVNMLYCSNNIENSLAPYGFHRKIFMLCIYIIETTTNADF